MPRLPLAAVCAALAVIGPPAAARAEEPKPDARALEFFEEQVRPLLAEQCVSCHGPDKQRGGLRADSRAALVAGGDSGPAVVPGKPGESRLLRAVRHEGDAPAMPPKTKLTPAQVAALAAWVEMGAPWPEAKADTRPVTAAAVFKVTDKDRAFWAFRPVREPALPAVNDAAWPKVPLDHFVLAKLEAAGLKPNPPADPRALCRRLHFDLVGLPPTPERADAFAAAAARDLQAALEALVDELLASPHYGERWGRHWLDVARYGEDQAHTFQARKYPDGWRYRDYVIGAFNADKPYDRFLTEQIAGDLLPDGDPKERLAALGFFALGPVYYGKSAADELDDRVDTLCRGVLGLTVACARCHDHKFDPISAHDYYALTGVFASTDYKEYVLTPDGDLDAKAAQEPKGPRKPALHGLAEGAKPANLRLHVRGNPQNLGEEVPRRFPMILSPAEPRPFTAGSGRLELARAVASADNPLTARVMVNRVWMHHFGRGIVGTPGNFGELGERPTHPELLDYLAARFVAEGWSVKKLHRTILLSAAYRVSSRHDGDAAKADPDNRLLWRMNRRKLEVEPLRDAALAAAGTLDRTVGGPSLELSAPSNTRRTLYAAVSRHNLDPMLRLFDFPDPNLTSDRRAATLVPLQELFVLNSDFMARQAKALTARVTAAHADDGDRIRFAYRLAYARPATDREVELGRKYLASAGAGGKAAAAWERYAQALLGANEFLFVD